jgi:hypothetical protein
MSETIIGIVLLGGGMAGLGALVALALAGWFERRGHWG